MRRPTNVSVNVGIESTRVLNADASRVLVFLSGANGQRYSVAFGEAATLDAGPTIQAGATGLLLTREMVGDIITQPMFAVASAAVQVGVMSVSES